MSFHKYYLNIFGVSSENLDILSLYGTQTYESIHEDIYFWSNFSIQVYNCNDSAFHDVNVSLHFPYGFHEHVCLRRNSDVNSGYIGYYTPTGPFFISLDIDINSSSFYVFYINSTVC